MNLWKAALLLPVCLLAGCGRPPEPAGTQPEPVLTVQSAAGLTDAAADMLMQTESALTVSVSPALYGAAEDCIAAARTRSVYCGMMLRAVTWERSGRYLTLHAFYAEPPEKVREKKQAVSEYAAEWAKTAALYPPEVRVLLAHELLCGSCSYSETAPDCGSAYGALLGSAARCSGYAEAFAALLEAAGVPVCTVAGTVTDGTAHAWNLVTLSGSRYHVDCTWDCTAENGDSHAFFLRNDSFMRQTHAWDAAAYPAAEGGALRYESIMQQIRDTVIPLSADKTGRRAFVSESR